MPVIPTEYIGNNAFPERPPQAEISPEAYGRDASTLAQVGGEIGNIGERLLQARKTAMEHDMVSNAESADQQWLPGAVNNLRKNFAKTNADGSPVINPDGSMAYDPTGFSDALKSQMNQRINDTVNSMPTGDAQRAYRSRTQTMFNDAYAGAYNWENQTRVQTMQNNIEVRAQGGINTIINSDHPYQDTMAELDRIGKDVNGASGPDGVMSVDNADKVLRSKSKGAIDAMFAAYSTHGPGMAQEGLDIINHITQDPTEPSASAGGNYEDAKRVSSFVDENALENYRSRLMTAKTTGDKEAVSAYEARYKGVMAGYNSTDPYVSSLVSSQDAHSLALQAIDMGNRHMMGQTAVQEHVMNLAMGQAFKQSRDSIVDTPESQKYVFDARMQQEYQSQLKNLGITDGSKFGLDKYEAQRKISDAMWNRSIKARNDDVNKYYEDNHPEAPGNIVGGMPDAGRLKAREDYAKGLAIDNQGLLSKAEAKSKAHDIMNQAQVNPDGAVAALESIKQNSLGYSDKVMADLEHEGKLPSYFSIAASAASPATEKQIIQLSGPDAKSLLSEESIAPGDKKELFGAVKSSWASAESAIRAVNPNPANEKYNTEMLGLAQKKAIIYKNSGMSDSAAATQATKDMFYDDYHIVGGSVFMPKQVGGVYTNPGLVEAKMKSIYSAPTSSFMAPGGNSRMTPDQLDATTSESVSSGKWVTDVSGPHPRSGAVFMVKDKNGLNTIPLQDEFGQKVRIDFAKTGNDVGAINAYKPFWESRLGSDGNPEKPGDTFIRNDVSPTAPPAQKWKNDNGIMDQQRVVPDKIKPGVAPEDDTQAAPPAGGRGLAKKDNTFWKEGSQTNIEVNPPSSYDGLETNGALPSAAKKSIMTPLAALPGKPSEAPAKQPPSGAKIETGSSSYTLSISGIPQYTREQIEGFVEKAAKDYKLSKSILMNQFGQESHLDQNTPDSKKGARGIGQLMPDTAAALGLKDGYFEHTTADGVVNGELHKDSYDAALNIDAGARLMRENMNRFHNDVRKSIAAYNWRPNAVERAARAAEAAGAKPTDKTYYASIEKHYPQETKDYLRKILGR